MLKTECSTTFSDTLYIVLALFKGMIFVSRFRLLFFGCSVMWRHESHEFNKDCRALMSAKIKQKILILPINYLISNQNRFQTVWCQKSFWIRILNQHDCTFWVAIELAVVRATFRIHFPHRISTKTQGRKVKVVITWLPSKLRFQSFDGPTW